MIKLNTLQATTMINPLVKTKNEIKYNKTLSSPLAITIILQNKGNYDQRKVENVMNIYF